MINQEIDIFIVKELSKRVNFNTYEISDAGLTTESDGLSSFIIPYHFNDSFIYHDEWTTFITFCYGRKNK